MRSPLQIKLDPEYQVLPTDGKTYCCECEEIIFSKIYQLVMFIDYEPIYTRFKYCESCYSEIVKDSDNRTEK